jgi:hypothetical protein
MTSVPWLERSIEQARLLNPAFLAALIWSCVKGYNSMSRQGMPYPLLFVAIPIILHKSTRENLPNKISKSLATWIGEHPNVHIHFVERAISLVPLVKEGIIFGVSGQLLQISSSQILLGEAPISINRFLRDSSDEVRDCMKKANFVGKWFASSGEYTTVMAFWGVTP